MLNGLRSEVQYQKFLKNSSFTTTQFDRIHDCWKDPELRKISSDGQQKAIAPIEKYLSEPNIGPRERRNAFLALEALEKSVATLNLDQAKSLQINALQNLRSDAEQLHLGNFELQIYREYSPVVELNRDTFNKALLPEVIEFYEKTLKIKNPSIFIANAYQDKIDREFEKLFWDEYVRNPKILHPPPTLWMNGNANGLFTDQNLRKYLSENFARLSQPEQKSVIARLVQYHREFESVLNADYIRYILQTLDTTMPSLTAKQLRKTIYAITRNYPIAFTDRVVYEEMHTVLMNAARLNLYDDDLHRLIYSTFSPKDRDLAAKEVFELKNQIRLQGTSERALTQAELNHYKPMDQSCLNILRIFTKN